MDLQYIIVGTGRSGTVYMARLLSSLGIPCSHEGIFSHDGLEAAKRRLANPGQIYLSYASTMNLIDGEWVPEETWLDDPSKAVADASYMAVPFLGDAVFSETKRIHVVRNPIKVVNSFCNYIDYFKGSAPSTPYEEFMYHHVPELRADIPQSDRAALYYVRWNQMIEQQRVDLFYRVEDSPENVVRFLERQGPYYTNKEANTYKKKVSQPFYPHKIATPQIREEFVALGKRYGYAMTTPTLL